MKKFPLGIQTFSEIRERNMLYIDKTEHIFKMIDNGKYYFLSRPRRFGKSLLVSTLKSIYKGEKHFFEDLYIYDKIDWKVYPIIHLDLTLINYENDAPDFKQSFINFIKQIGQNYGLKVVELHSIENAIYWIARELKKKFQSKVVVLIDEYDKPILDLIGNPDKIEESRNVLHEFYSCFKSLDEYWEFVFITGISRFSKVALFSGMNNLNDITLDSNYATITGYTQQELNKHFSVEIKKLAKKYNSSLSDIKAVVKKWYNGYSWNGIDKVYNPVSIFLLFDRYEFENYWFQTGSPSFLVNEIFRQGFTLTDLEKIDDATDLMESVRFDSINLDALLWQAGYLTIESIVRKTPFNAPQYSLTFPNYEVKYSLLNWLLPAYIKKTDSKTIGLTSKLYEAFYSGNVAIVCETFQILFASIPYDLHIGREAYYHSVLYAALMVLGYDVRVEVHTAKGRLDAVVQTQENTWVIELKYADNGEGLALAQTALEQIKNLGYDAPFRAEGVDVFLLGLAMVDKELFWVSE